MRAAVRDSVLAIGVSERDRARDGEMEVTRRRYVGPYFEWSSVEAARALLGRPAVGPERDAGRSGGATADSGVYASGGLCMTVTSCGVTVSRKGKVEDGLNTNPTHCL